MHRPWCHVSVSTEPELCKVLGAEGSARLCRLRESEKREMDPSHKVKGKKLPQEGPSFGFRQIFLHIFQGDEIASQS